jgi:hypothetical protein
VPSGIYEYLHEVYSTATEMEALRRSSRISGKERLRKVTIRQQTGLEETIMKEIKQNHLT